VETPYIYRIIKRALAAHVPLFLTGVIVDNTVVGKEGQKPTNNMKAKKDSNYALPDP
jgi:hypothetical protein